MSKKPDLIELFSPSASFSETSFLHSPMEAEALRKLAGFEPDQFWAECASALDWEKPFQKVFEGTISHPRWFVGGRLNVSHNCVGRHLARHGSKVAITWEGESYGDEEEGAQRWITYRELDQKIRGIAKGLRACGVKKGDRVILYMPLVPETLMTMLACAHVGAVHSVIFAGFSAQSIYDRVTDAGAEIILTADGTYRRGEFLKLHERVHEALTLGAHSVRHVVVCSRDDVSGVTVQAKLQKERDLTWAEFLKRGESSGASDAYEWMDSEDPLFILYTSGTTGKPKGVLHTQAGYLVWAFWTTQWVFDLNEQDLFWCTADCGWITGHTYVTYGPLALGAGIFIYEGAPQFPHEYRFWELIERHHATIFYTAPTALRALMKSDEKKIGEYDLSTLRLLGSVGEPINPEVWRWFHRVIGGGRCPIVDTWWQTETGGILIAPLPGATPLAPGSATFPLPGVEADIVNAHGENVKDGEEGVLVIRQPWPGMARTIWGDAERFQKTYFDPFPGAFCAHDFARRDERGFFWILGRADDVINVSGHRLGSAEVESALVSHPRVSESAVVGYPHELKGEALAAFVVLRSGVAEQQLVQDLKEHVGKMIGGIARPDRLYIVKNLPKTRSGKIMRRLLREFAVHGEIRGDTTTLEEGASLEVLL